MLKSKLILILAIVNLTLFACKSNSTQKEKYKKELKKFQAILDAMPQKDAWPKYRPMAANPWDKKVKSEKK